MSKLIPNEEQDPLPREVQEEVDELAVLGYEETEDDLVEELIETTNLTVQEAEDFIEEFELDHLPPGWFY